MGKRSFLASFGIFVAVFSLFALWMTRAPTSLIGAAIGVAIAVTASPRWRSPLAWKASIALTALLLVQALTRLYRNAGAEPDFGTFFFGTLVAMSLTSLLIVLSGGRSSAPHSPPGEATDPSRLSEPRMVLSSGDREQAEWRPLRMSNAKAGPFHDGVVP